MVAESEERIEESTFKNAQTGEELNVCYDGELVFFTFYDKDGRAYKKAIYDITISEDTIASTLEDYAGDVL